MIFLSYDAIKKEECETEIRGVDIATPHLFIQSWVSDFIYRTLKDGPNFKYSLFPWDKIMKSTFVVGSPWRCYGAFTNIRLDGLLCLGVNTKLEIKFIATAPWNYYTIGKMRRIGSGLIYFTIKTSEYLGKDGEFMLNAVPDAEEFYEGIGMIATGTKNQAGLKEFCMAKDNAVSFRERFRKYVVKE
jgi:hypothetical protein